MLGLWSGSESKLPDDCIRIGNPRTDNLERKVIGSLLEEEVDGLLTRTVRKDVVKRIDGGSEFNGGECWKVEETWV